MAETNTSRLCKLDLALLEAVNKLPYQSYMLVANLKNNEHMMSHFIHQLITAAVLLPGKVGAARAASAGAARAAPTRPPCALAGAAWALLRNVCVQAVSGRV
jgi:hypothetical protein